jgi:YD repeat-containing protein
VCCAALPQIGRLTSLGCILSTSRQSHKRASNWESYDANGNPTEKEDGTNVSSYKYGFGNLMTDYEGPGANNDTTYRYYAAGRRVEKIDHTGQSAVTTRWYLDGWSVIEHGTGTMRSRPPTSTAPAWMSTS